MKQDGGVIIEIPGIDPPDWRRDDASGYPVRRIESALNGEGFEIDLTRMYESPIMSLDLLLLLAEHFGTQRIDVDNISEGGCETCDWGSRYGYEVQVFGATKNDPFADGGEALR